MSTAIHTLHVVLAGVWLGGVLFTTLVVSPALKAMKWSEAERVGVRSVIGNQYARIGTANLVLLLVGRLRWVAEGIWCGSLRRIRVAGGGIRAGSRSRGVLRPEAGAAGRGRATHRECRGGPRLRRKAPQLAETLPGGLLGKHPDQRGGCGACCRCVMKPATASEGGVPDQTEVFEALGYPGRL